MKAKALIMDLEVKVIVDQDKNSCLCSSYLCHWENHAERKAEICYRDGCNEKSELIGTKVTNEDKGNDINYVVPLCRSCIQDVGSAYFKLKDNWILVRTTSRFRCSPCDRS